MRKNLLHIKKQKYFAQKIVRSNIKYNMIKNIILNLDKTAKNYLAARGYDSAYGARPLKRVIQREIENVLAEKILRGEVAEGQEVKVLAKGEKLVFI